MEKTKSAEAANISREKSVGAGIKRKDITFTRDTYMMLWELAEQSGFEITKGNKGKAISLVLAQVTWECYERRDDLKWSKRNQEGFRLAREAKKLKKKGKSASDIAYHLKAYKPKTYLRGPTGGNKWTKNTIDRLIDTYYYKFASQHKKKN